MRLFFGASLIFTNSKSLRIKRLSVIAQMGSPARGVGLDFKGRVFLEHRAGFGKLFDKGVVESQALWKDYRFGLSADALETPSSA